MKRVITEEDGVHPTWYETAKQQTLATLPDFLRHLAEDYQHDYGTIVHAMSAGAIAAASALDHSPAGGITGFQAGAVMWGFIANWSGDYKDKPLRLVNYEHLLYPQYADHFALTISSETWQWAQEQARRLLAERPNDDLVSERVRAHWQTIADGIPPFGLTVQEGAA